ncbi:hypothetical protein LXL04_007554 [Taraxacum kok-saghyz]
MSRRGIHFQLRALQFERLDGDLYTFYKDTPAPPYKANNPKKIHDFPFGVLSTSEPGFIYHLRNSKERRYFKVSEKHFYSSSFLSKVITKPEFMRVPLRSPTTSKRPSVGGFKSIGQDQGHYPDLARNMLWLGALPRVCNNSSGSTFALSLTSIVLGNGQLSSGIILGQPVQQLEPPDQPVTRGSRFVAFIVACMGSIGPNGGGGKWGLERDDCGLTRFNVLEYGGSNENKL